MTNHPGDHQYAGPFTTFAEAQSALLALEQAENRPCDILNIHLSIWWV